MRGEYDSRFLCGIIALGSPPHARGIRIGRSARVDRGGITPACAGNTRPVFYSFDFSRDHPRMRGEYSYSVLPFSASLGSPPHARGILLFS